MNFNRWIREGHRWLSIVFTAAVIANVVASLEKKETVWTGLMALVPLGLLLLTGLYLFVLPISPDGAGAVAAQGAWRRLRFSRHRPEATV